MARARITSRGQITIPREIRDEMGVGPGDNEPPIREETRIVFSSLIRFIGRVLMSAMFIQGGWNAANDPGGRVNAAASLGLPEPELAVRANGWAMFFGGIALALGIFKRLAAFVLFVCLVPTTYAGHAFWAETDPQKRRQQLVHFLKNLSMLGGLLLVVVGQKTEAEDE